jgi:hypothetical protein
LFDTAVSICRICVGSLFMPAPLFPRPAACAALSRSVFSQDLPLNCGDDVAAGGSFMYIVVPISRCSMTDPVGSSIVSCAFLPAKSCTPVPPNRMSVEPPPPGEPAVS